MVFRVWDEVGSGDRFVGMFWNEVLFRRIFEEMMKSRVRDVIVVREEVVYEVLGGKDRFGWVRCGCIRDRGDSGWG